MKVEELNETTEQAHHAGAKAIGLTTAIVAVLLAVATLLGHRSHTEEVIVQGDRNTQWVNYDTKTIRATVDEAAAALADLMPDGKERSALLAEKAKAEREGEPARDGKPAKLGADKTREKAQELDAELKLMQRRSARYDAAELFLEISIVLCSIALLAEDKLYWKLSFVTTAVGVGITAWGLLL
jgi:Domain of unknown function (DUF4337)